MIAALYVQASGCYAGLPDVDPWPEERDARTYAGPWPVVAHPPCERWGRYWSGGPSAKVRRKKGDDGGCFAAALKAVRRWGGVLEHPKDSHAWAAFHLRHPPHAGGWVPADPDTHAGGHRAGTCCVEQGHYGHAARKATWLYYVGPRPPDLRWGRAPGTFRRLDAGYHAAEERHHGEAARRAARRGALERLSARQRAATPIEFRDLLLTLARLGGTR